METAVQAVSEDLEQFTYVLAIKHFNMCVNQECISSEYFVANGLFETEWRLRVYPRGKTDKDLKYISCLLSRAGEDKGPDDITLRLKMGLIDKDLNEQEVQAINGKRFRKNSIHGFRNFLELEPLFKVKDSLLPQNTLTIFCHMEMLWLKETWLYYTSKHFGCKRNKFSWSVQAFSICSENEKKTTIAQFEPKPQFEISLHVADRIVKIEIRRIGKSKTELFLVRGAITVMNSQGDESKLCGVGQHLFRRDPDDVWLFPTFLITDDLNSTLLCGDILTLFCDFTIDTSIKELKFECGFAYWELPPLDTARISQYRDMECLFECKSHLDEERRGMENETASVRKRTRSVKVVDPFFQQWGLVYPVHKKGSGQEAAA